MLLAVLTEAEQTALLRLLTQTANLSEDLIPLLARLQECNTLQSLQSSESPATSYCSIQALDTINTLEQDDILGRHCMLLMSWY